MLRLTFNSCHHLCFIETNARNAGVQQLTAKARQGKASGHMLRGINWLNNFPKKLPHHDRWSFSGQSRHSLARRVPSIHHRQLQQKPTLQSTTAPPDRTTDTTAADTTKSDE